MTERDWQKDWECIQQLKGTYLDAFKLYPSKNVMTVEVPWVVAFGEYYLQRVRELEKENRKLQYIANLLDGYYNTESQALQFINVLCECGNLYDRTQQLEEQVRELEAKVAAMREIVEEIAYTTPTFEDERLEWVEIQIYKDTLEKARRLLAEERGD